jgi:hypothetical protein
MNAEVVARLNAELIARRKANLMLLEVARNSKERKEVRQQALAEFEAEKALRYLRYLARLLLKRGDPDNLLPFDDIALVMGSTKGEIFDVYKTAMKKISKAIKSNPQQKQALREYLSFQEQEIMDTIL